VITYLLGIGVMLGGHGRLISMRKMGLPKEGNIFLVYVFSELFIPWAMWFS
jgi:hypothetical protein